MQNEIVAAAAFFVRVCVEHSRAFPLRNILVVADGFANADDEDRSIADVEDVLNRYRLGEDFDGLDDALRNEFGEL